MHRISASTKISLAINILLLVWLVFFRSPDRVMAANSVATAYKVIRVPKTREEKEALLNAYGQRWQLCAVSGFEGEGYYFIFKQEQ